MAQRHHDLTDSAAGAPVTGDALAGYLRARATEFLRALRLQREGGSHGGTDEAAEAARALRRSARRISGSLHTFRALLDADWSEEIRPELAWLSGTLALEHAYEARLERLLLALQRLSGATAVPVQGAGGGAPCTGRPTSPTRARRPPRPGPPRARPTHRPPRAPSQAHRPPPAPPEARPAPPAPRPRPSLPAPPGARPPRPVARARPPTPAPRAPPRPPPGPWPPRPAP